MYIRAATAFLQNAIWTPDFSTNYYVYAYVTAAPPTAPAPAKDPNTGSVFNRVIRFTESENKAVEKKILLDNIPVGKARQFAGALAFGPDDRLYVTPGYDNQLSRAGWGQNINLTGEVLRINRDGTIPADNPFPNSPIFTQGHRTCLELPLIT